MPGGTACCSACFFFSNDTATTEIYTLSLHDALPISDTIPATASVPTPRVPGPQPRPRRHPPTGQRRLRRTRLLHAIAELRHPPGEHLPHHRNRLRFALGLPGRLDLIGVT